MKFRRLLPLVFALSAGFLQYALLGMFEAGQRQGLWVLASSFISAMTAVYGMPQLTASKILQFLICVLAPASIACAALLVGEKMDRPEVAVFFRPGGLKVVALTILITAGWLVGLAAFCGMFLESLKMPPVKPTDR
jgi:hypothetical protein